jgi:serine protease
MKNKNNKRNLSSFIALLCMLAVTTPVWAAPEFGVRELAISSTAEYVPDEVLVKFKNGGKPFEVMKVQNVQAALKILKNNPNVEFAEPNYRVTAFATPNDPFYKYQWNFASFEKAGGVDAEAVWNITTGDSSVVVAVIDTGIAYENYQSYGQAPDLAGTCFKSGYDFVNNDDRANDDNGHGTHVAGTIAGTTNDGYGVAGLAHGVCLMPIKVLGADGGGTVDAVAKGIRFAADNNANVINLSLGGSSPSRAIEDALAYAHGKGVTIVAATGNNNGAVSYPAAYDNYVIAVGATAYGGVRANYSNYGNSIDVVAPGGDGNDRNRDGYVDGILQQTLVSGTLNSFGYHFYTGTSMATPHVAAAAALLLSVKPSLSPAQIQALLEETAHDLGSAGFDQYYGHGLINIKEALLLAEGEGSVTPPPPAPSIIELGVTTRRVRQNYFADLSWTGTNGSSVTVYRDGKAITTTTSSTYSDRLGKKVASQYVYQVCQTATLSNCSEKKTASF